MVETIEELSIVARFVSDQCPKNPPMRLPWAGPYVRRHQAGETTKRPPGGGPAACPRGAEAVSRAPGAQAPVKSRHNGSDEPNG